MHDSYISKNYNQCQQLFPSGNGPPRDLQIPLSLKLSSTSFANSKHHDFEQFKYAFQSTCKIVYHAHECGLSGYHLPQNHSYFRI
jgi:hypothetical protein